MQEFIIHFMEQYGYWGMGILIAAENLFPPIPSELILTFGGFMTRCTALKMPGMILYATLGSLAGAFALYGIGRAVGTQRMEKLMQHPLMQRIGFRRESFQKAVQKFNRQGGRRAVLLGRCIPIVRSLVSIPAGMARMDLCSFFWLTAIGSLVWNTALLSLGAAAGTSWQLMEEKCSLYLQNIKIAAVTAAAFWLAFKALKAKYRKKRREQV